MSTMEHAGVSVRQIIDSGAVETHFQPILSARQRAVMGAEALSRGVMGVEALSRGAGAIHPQTKVLIPPLKLFEMAAAEGVVVELDRLCRVNAVRTFARLDRHEDLILFMNFNAASMEHADGAQHALDDLLKIVNEANLSPRNVAIEILESAFTETKELEKGLAAFSEHGFLVALDDVGTGYSNLDRISTIKPDVLKLDRSLINGIDRDHHRRELFKSLVQLTRRIGALVVAEGVETHQQAITALELGADLLQGYFLGMPQHSGDLLCRDAAQRIDALARRYKAYMIQRINERKLQHRRFNIIMNEILCELSKVDAEEFDDVLHTTLPQYDNVECVYVMDEAGIQISSTVCNHRIPSRRRGVMFRPAPRGADHSLKEYYYVLLDVELNKYTTDPYVSLATGNLCRTISTCFRDAHNNKMYILCIDVLCE